MSLFDKFLLFWSGTLEEGGGVPGSAKPFLKWAGGKRWLVREFQDKIPGTFGKYFEPFLGSGAVFFHVKPAAAILSDKNVDLIGTYNSVRENFENVIRILELHKQKHSKEYYYKIRESEPSLPEERAARFIYLNRVCWNGLYRVNRAGKFNVPIGTKTTFEIDHGEWKQASELLKKASISSGDFNDTVAKAQRNDFVYCDPPYTVTHNNNGFVKYNEDIFKWDDQVRLSVALRKAKKRRGERKHGGKAMERSHITPAGATPP